MHDFLKTRPFILLFSFRLERIHLCFVGSALGPFLRYFFIQKLSSALFPAFRAKDSRYWDIFQFLAACDADFVGYGDHYLFILLLCIYIGVFRWWDRQDLNPR
jgi:hypothetical protein